MGLISCYFVLRILDSIIGRDDCALRSIIFPKRWCSSRGGNIALNEFMWRCNQVFEARHITCPGCDRLVEDTSQLSWQLSWFPPSGVYYGSQNFTCYNCLRHFCYSCDDENGKDLLRHCNHCKMDYCRQCEPIEKCVDCEHYYCRECKSMSKCAECGDYYAGIAGGANH